MADSIKLPENTNKQEILSGESIEENKQISGGFIRYYGLYWDRNFVFLERESNAGRSDR